MADQPANTNETTLRQMIDMMSSYPDDTVFRWFTVDATKAVCVTMKQVREELEKIGAHCPGCNESHL